MTRRAGLVVLGLVLAAGLVGAAYAGTLTDLAPYRYGGRAALDGLPLYGVRDPLSGLPFTYPPFGALVMVPLAMVSLPLAGALVTAASVAALARVVAMPVLVVAALAMEPVWQDMRFGQVNLLLMLAVLVDLARPERKASGALVGLAAGVKLTPLVFVVLLVMVGRRDAALRAAATFAATVALGFVVMPGQSAAYWSHRLLDGTRVGPPELTHNQSVYGVLSRLLGEPPPVALWVLVAGPLALAVLVVAALWWRRGDRLLGTGLAGLAMLVASPVSWSHHWVWAVPLTVAVWRHSRAVALAWAVVFVARPILWPPWGDGREHDWDLAQHLVGNAYLLAAAGLVVWATTRLRAGPIVGVVSDEDIQARIKGLIDQEHDLRQKLGAGEISSEDEHADLARIEVELDQCWDLLRQRRARREFGQDPEAAEVRDAGTVEHYQG
jgi:alpha-1,2-mannosyltransferase